MATSSQRHTLGDRGVVSLVGLAMACFMTSLVYYEIGVGDAIAFKEQLQDASDSAGFSAAVYHAEGMNMMVFINLIMAAVLAVIVVLRVLQLLFGIISVVIPAICWIPGLEWLCPYDADAVDAEIWVSRLEEKAAPYVRKALIGLNDASTAIAVGMPWVSLVKAGTVGVQYYPQVTSSVGGGTIMLSVSLMPDLTWIPPVGSASASANSKIEKWLNAEEDPNKNAGTRWGLPVQDGEFDTLCDEAGQVIPDILEWAITAAVTGSAASTDPNKNPPTWISWINKFIGGVIGSWPQFFCDESAMTTGQLDSQINQQAQTQCDDERSEWNECQKQIQPGQFILMSGPCANGVGQKVLAADGKPFDTNACLTEQKEKITSEANAANNDSSSSSLKNSVLPKAIYSFAANGNDYMAVWSFGWGRFNNAEESGVSLAEWLSSGLVAAKSTHPTMLTKAEFYYAVENPCKKPGQDEGLKGSSTLCTTDMNMPFWGDYQGDTMWNPRWRARLRRVSPPMIPVGQMASAGLGSFVDKALSKVPGGEAKDEVTEFVTGFLQVPGGMADGEIAGLWEKQFGYLH